MSADDVEYLAPGEHQGFNLYAHCGNNPVMRTDPKGEAWWDWLLGGLVIVGAVVLSVVTAGLAVPVTTALGGGLLTSIAAGAVTGAIGGAISSFGISVGTQAITTGFDNINWGTVGIGNVKRSDCRRHSGRRVWRGKPLYIEWDESG